MQSVEEHASSGTSDWRRVSSSLERHDQLPVPAAWCVRIPGYYTGEHHVQSTLVISQVLHFMPTLAIWIIMNYNIIKAYCYIHRIYYDLYILIL